MWISSRPDPARQWRLAAALTGFAIWAAATAMIQAIGIRLFADLLWMRMLLFGGSAIGALMLVRAVSGVLRAPAGQVAVWLALPGMLLDAGALLLWAHLFPDLAGAERLFGALMLWVYACTLVAGLLPDRVAGGSPMV